MVIATVAIVALLAALPLAATAMVYAASRDRGESATEPLGPAGIALAFGREWAATIALLLASPFRLPRATPPPAPRGVVVFVPELLSSSAAFWYLRRRLRAAGWDSIAGMERGPRDDAAARAALDARITALPAGMVVVIAGHGIGGRWACRYAAARPDVRIRHTVTLGTPHRGSTALPYRLLRAGAPPPETPTAAPGDVIALYSDFDAWLRPVDDAYCPGGFNIAVSGVGHCAMLLSPRVADLLVENLTAPLPDKGRL
jgi:pimeloyl-ACP methyl ester carboxylesterase